MGRWWSEILAAAVAIAPPSLSLVFQFTFEVKKRNESYAAFSLFFFPEEQQESEVRTLCFRPVVLI